MVEGDLRRDVALNIKRLQKSDATEVFVTDVVCLAVVRRQRQMQEPVKVLREQLLTRRNNP